MKRSILLFIKEPLLYIFLALFFTSAIYKSRLHGYQFPDLLFGLILFSAIIPGIISIASKKIKNRKYHISYMASDFSLAIIYFILWLILFMFEGKTILSSRTLSVGLGFWGLLFFLPLAYFLLKRHGISQLGFNISDFRSNMLITLISCAFLGLLLIFITPGGRYIRNTDPSEMQLLKAFAIAFAYALVFAAIFEEFFFRAVLQSTSSKFLKSDLKGILIASILFGLYHLPFQFYHEGPAQGEILLSLSNVFTEQMIAAPIFGVLWSRTHSLLAPISVHALIDAISLIPQMAEQHNPF